jgi:YVTN family beta-propeller protein
VVVEPTGRFAYVTNLYDDDVAVIDLDRLAVVAKVRVGDMPNGISFSPVPVPAGPDIELTMPHVDSDAGGHGH